MFRILGNLCIVVFEKEIGMNQEMFWMTVALVVCGLYMFVGVGIYGWHLDMDGNEAPNRPYGFVVGALCLLWSTWMIYVAVSKP